MDRKETAAVIEDIKSGNTGAFGLIYDEYHRLAASVLRKVGRCPYHEMDFHLNGLFFEIYKSLEGFRQESGLSTFIYKISLRYAYKIYHKGKKESSRYARLDENITATGPQNWDDALLAERLLDSLNDNLRAVTVLFYYERLPLAEIAAILGISVTAAKNRVFQAREKLRAELEVPEDRPSED